MVDTGTLSRRKTHSSYIFKLPIILGISLWARQSQLFFQGCKCRWLFSFPRHKICGFDSIQTFTPETPTTLPTKSVIYHGNNIAREN